MLGSIWAPILWTIFLEKSIFVVHLVLLTIEISSLDMESEVENMEYATLEESEEEIESTEVTPQEQASKVVEITVSEVIAEVKTEDTEKNAEGKEEDPFSGGCEPSSKRVPQKGKKVKKPKKKASTKKVQEKEETEPIPLAKTSSSKQKSIFTICFWLLRNSKAANGCRTKVWLYPHRFRVGIFKNSHSSHRWIMHIQY